ncbi:MAG: HAMP domain-containing sensor histidine kinase [Pseudomonadota bacterium]
MSDKAKDAPAARGPGDGEEPSAPGAVALPPDLVARLAHELKTPLGAIAAASEIMRDERFGPIGDARYRGYAADIHTSARHALDLIGRMLAERTPGAAEPALAFVEVDLNALVSDVLSALRPLAEQSRLTLAGTLAPRLAHVIADVTSLRQILINLLSNALKFTAAGGVIEVTTRQTPVGALEVEVRDEGAGMAEAELSYARGESDAPKPDTQRAGQGLGIGLPLSRALAAANGATLVIASRSGEGTTATLSFPVSRVVPV